MGSERGRDGSARKGVLRQVSAATGAVRARKLDPGGDQGPEWVALRDLASGHLYTDAGSDATTLVKPPLHPGERPLPPPR